MSNPPPRLPGFLRRSLRNPYELDESTSSSAGSRKVDGDATMDASNIAAEGEVRSLPASVTLANHGISIGKGTQYLRCYGLPVEVGMFLSLTKPVALSTAIVQVAVSPFVLVCWTAQMITLRRE